MSLAQPLPPAPTNRRFVLQILGIFVTLAVLAAGAVIAVRVTHQPHRSGDITELDTSMVVGRQDFPAEAGTFEGPESTSTDATHVSPQTCEALAGPPARQSAYIDQSSDSTHALAMRISLPDKVFDYTADARACSRYELGGGMIVDVDHRIELDGLPAWAVIVTETVSDRGSLITPFAGRKVVGRYRGVYLVGICLMPTTDQLRACDEPLVQLFNAQVRKLASV